MCQASGANALEGRWFGFVRPLRVCAPDIQEHRLGQIVDEEQEALAFEGGLSCGLLGAIDIHDQPVVAQAVPEATGWKGLSRLGDKVVLKEPSQGLNTWLIQSGQKATERGAMRQLLPIEEGHERDGKRGESLIKCQQGWFCTHGIPEKHHHKIKHLIGTEARTGQSDLVLDGGKQTRGGEAVGYNGHFTKPARNRGNLFRRNLDVNGWWCHTMCGLLLRICFTSF